MHQHYHTITQLSAALQQRLKGHNLRNAFTLSKTELILCFVSGTDELIMKLIIDSGHCYLFFENTEPKRGSNSQPVFEPLWSKPLEGITQHPFNRSFEMDFGRGQLLIFKMYDALANVVRFEGQKPVELFRTDIKNDASLAYSSLIGQEDTFGEPPKGGFYIYRDNGGYVFALEKLAGPELLFESADVLEALSQYSRLHLSRNNFIREKQSVLQRLKEELKRKKVFLAKTKASLDRIMFEVPPDEIGHILMANLHAISPQQTSVMLDDFYRNKKIEIRLKKELNAQQNAAYYYRKADNRKIEVRQLEEKITHAEKRMAELETLLTEAAAVNDMRSLKPFLVQKKQREQKEIPFKEFERDGYVIWVGKNAANNDLLTMKYAHKNDLWLHAKGVSGSHVVVRFKAGRDFPKSVIEYAASLAAHYSKLSGSKLVAVSYTLKKFVRKPKGSEPGAVTVDREEVVMVEPGINQKS